MAAGGGLEQNMDGGQRSDYALRVTWVIGSCDHADWVFLFTTEDVNKEFPFRGK